MAKNIRASNRIKSCKCVGAPVFCFLDALVYKFQNTLKMKKRPNSFRWCLFLLTIQQQKLKQPENVSKFVGVRWFKRLFLKRESLNLDINVKFPCTRSIARWLNDHNVALSRRRPGCDSRFLS